VVSAWAAVAVAAAAAASDEGWLMQAVEAGARLVDTVEEGTGCATLLVAAPSVTTADDAGWAALLRLSPALVDDTCRHPSRRAPISTVVAAGADLNLDLREFVRSSLGISLWRGSGVHAPGCRWWSCRRPR
jgi:hypothetical protein